MEMAMEAVAPSFPLDPPNGRDAPAGALLRSPGASVFVALSLERSGA